MSDTLNGQEPIINESDGKEEIGPSLPTAEKKDIFDGEVKDFIILNGFPQYKEGHILAGRCKIFERIGWNDKVGPTWLAIGPDNKELVLRVSNDKVSTAKSEAEFLCKAEQENKWHLFSQVHSIFHHDNCTFLALYFRGGPTLSQCLEFIKKSFTHGSAGRLAEDILDIVRTVHTLGYRVTDLELDQFHFDAASRHLFMADISWFYKLLDYKNDRAAGSWWKGSHFAPIAFHKRKEIYDRDEFEAWFFVFLHLVGELPWHGENISTIHNSKLNFAPESISDNLPSQYREIYEIITCEPPNKPVSEEDFGKIKKLLKEIYQEVGGIRDHDENFDFEREPIEDELPKFVAERIPTINKEVEDEDVKIVE